MKPTIIIDSREKPRAIGEIVKYFDRKGIDHIGNKLFSGDYQMMDNAYVVVDRKGSFNEIASNLTKDHKRLAAECDRAYEHGIRLYFLIENSDGVTNIDELGKWKNTRYLMWLHNGKKGRPPLSSGRLKKIMKSFEVSHHVKFYFCKPESTGRAILFLLTGNDYGL